MKIIPKITKIMGITVEAKVGTGVPREFTATKLPKITPIKRLIKPATRNIPITASEKRK